MITDTPLWDWILRGLPNEALKVICLDLCLNFSGSKTDLIHNIKEYWKSWRLFVP